ncbi:MAG: hypothetical protein WCV56_03670 [Candidatus Omnitrophota bacterium]
MKKMKKKKIEKGDLAEVARRKRYISLLEKMKWSKPLSPAEIRELERYQKGPVRSGQVESVEEVAKAFSVSVRTVFNWIRDGAPVEADGTYDLLAIQAWKISRTPGKSKAGEKEQWDVEYRRIKFLLAEIEYKHKLGELLPREEVEDGVLRLFTEARKRFQFLPQRVAPQLEGMDVHARAALLTDRVNEICNDLRHGPWITDAIFEKSQKLLLLQEEGQNDETESGDSKTQVAG